MEPLEQRAEEYLHLLYALTSFSKHLQAKEHKHLETLGLTRQRSAVLQSLALFPCLGLKELAQTLAVSSSSLSIMVEHLVQEGYLYRESHEEDRRRIILRLSTAGKEQVHKLEEGLKEAMERWLQRMDEEEQKNFQRAVQTILNSLQVHGWP